MAMASYQVLQLPGDMIVCVPAGTPATNVNQSSPLVLPQGTLFVNGSTNSISLLPTVSSTNIPINVCDSPIQQKQSLENDEVDDNLATYQQGPLIIAEPRTTAATSSQSIETSLSKPPPLLFYDCEGDKISDSGDVESHKKKSGFVESGKNTGDLSLSETISACDLSNFISDIDPSPTAIQIQPDNMSAMPPKVSSICPVPSLIPMVSSSDADVSEEHNIICTPPHDSGQMINFNNQVKDGVFEEEDDTREPYPVAIISNGLLKVPITSLQSNEGGKDSLPMDQTSNTSNFIISNVVSLKDAHDDDTQDGAADASTMIDLSCCLSDEDDNGDVSQQQLCSESDVSIRDEDVTIIGSNNRTDYAVEKGNSKQCSASRVHSTDKSCSSTCISESQEIQQTDGKFYHHRLHKQKLCTAPLSANERIESIKKRQKLTSAKKAVVPVVSFITSKKSIVKKSTSGEKKEKETGKYSLVGHSHGRISRKTGAKQLIYACKSCGAHFVKEDLKKQHELSHEGKRTYECHLCRAKFSTPAIRQEHEWMHSGQRRYACRYCGLRFASDSILASHDWQHNPTSGLVAQNPHKYVIVGDDKV